jgi:hypothetical protein
MLGISLLALSFSSGCSATPGEDRRGGLGYSVDTRSNARSSQSVGFSFVLSVVLVWILFHILLAREADLGEIRCSIHARERVEGQPPLGEHGGLL